MAGNSCKKGKSSLSSNNSVVNFLSLTLIKTSKDLPFPSSVPAYQSKYLCNYFQIHHADST